ncbi:hypothetical protein [Nostoc sp.]|uniref:hypothetical protein n=1 Tax=Nostoc sp. TaxID=1180 RepID=UPI002FF6A83A
MGIGEPVRWGGSAVFSQGETPRAMGSHATPFKSAKPPNGVAPQVEQLPSAFPTCSPAGKQAMCSFFDRKNN